MSADEIAPTPFVEIEKMISDKPDLRLGCGYEQGWPGLYVYDEKTGLVVASEDVEPTDAFVDKYLDHAPIGAASSAIALMAPGERPTEPGWYVIDVTEDGEDFHSGRAIYEVDSDLTITLWEAFADTMKLGVDSARFTFIARIYPDRIL